MDCSLLRYSKETVLTYVNNPMHTQPSRVPSIRYQYLIPTTSHHSLTKSCHCILDISNMAKSACYLLPSQWPWPLFIFELHILFFFSLVPPSPPSPPKRLIRSLDSNSRFLYCNICLVEYSRCSKERGAPFETLFSLEYFVTYTVLCTIRQGYPLHT